MNGLDIAFFVICLFFFIRGIFRGLIKELTSTAGLLVGFVLARTYYNNMADLLTTFVQNPSFRQALGFLIIFLGVSLLISLIGLLLDRVVKVTMGNVANGLLGAMVGLIKAMALAAVVLMVTTAFIRPDTPFFQESVTWPYISFVSNSLREMVPPDLKKVLENKTSLIPDGLKDKLPELPKLDDKKPPDWKKVPPGSAKKDAPSWPGSTDKR